VHDLETCCHLEQHILVDNVHLMLVFPISIEDGDVDKEMVKVGALLGDPFLIGTALSLFDSCEIDFGG